MKKLKRLFGPTALPSTIATGLLLLSTAKAFATWYYVSAVAGGGGPNDLPTEIQQQCPYTYCRTGDTACNDRYYFWCCSETTYSCGGGDHVGSLITCGFPPETSTGYCYSSP